jgi:hypothetical protein
MNTRRRVITLLFIAGFALSAAGVSARAEDKSTDLSKLHGKWIYLSVTKTIDGEQKETSMSNSALSFNEQGEFSQYAFARNRIVGHKGTYRLNKGGSLVMEYDGGKLGPFKFSFSDDGKLLTLSNVEETYKLKFKEE